MFGRARFLLAVLIVSLVAGCTEPRSGGETAPSDASDLDAGSLDLGLFDGPALDSVPGAETSSAAPDGPPDGPVSVDAPVAIDAPVVVDAPVDSAVCSGPTSQSCNCTGTATRTCNDGVWSPWTCTGGSNTGSDPQNCGSCGHVCASGTCNGGTCACPTCGACQTCDASSGSCVAATGVPCPVTHGGGTCNAQGNCQARSCDPGFVMCAGVCTAESDHTCGPSCNDCYLPPNSASPQIQIANCLNHACKITQCTTVGPFCAMCPKIPTWGDCNGDWKDGCEVDLTTDGNNCGDCGQSCSVCQPGSLEPWCQTCTASPCTPCRMHPHTGGPNIGCGG